MQRYFIYFSYDGTAYHGWQVQPGSNSVQHEMQRALSLLMGRDMSVVGAGRTDAGVHAHMMVAHFDTEEPIADCPQLAYKLNRVLPRDIAVDRIVSVPSDCHARFSAVARTYHYYIHTHKAPFLRHYSNEMTYRLDFQAMNDAAAHLLSVSDFAAFCKSGGDQKTTICHVSEARWTEMDEPGRWCFVITANRFLRNMVRAIVGTLVEVGRGRMTVEDFRRVIERRDRCQAGESVPACGLYLWDIRYD